MKPYYYLIAGAFLIFGLSSCQKIIDVEPISNEGVDNFYRNYNEVNAALTGAYNGLQAPLLNEWRMTDLRTDNVKVNVINSSSSENVLLLHMDTYELNSTHAHVYNYWISVYKNIRSINYVLENLGVSYAKGQLEFGERVASMTEEQRDQLSGEALFLRAYHYFNLVRLYGGVFLITDPVDPKIAKQVNRSSVQDCYALIIADLKAAESRLPRIKYEQISNANQGRATTWAAKGLLAKVFLTLGRNGEALPLLDDIIQNSGYGLENSYASVFSINNEMNKEILFSVRYKSGGLGLGNYMANYFAPLNSGNAVVNGDGMGHNYPTTSLSQAYRTSAPGAVDQRKAVNIGAYNALLYSKKFISAVLIENDAENDFPVLRYADILLMKAEALGFDGPDGLAMSLINQVRQRAGGIPYSSGDFNTGLYLYPTSGADTHAITSSEAFLNALLEERRLELAFENQRFFDLVRTGKAIEVIRNYYAEEFESHYKRYTLTLEELQAKATPERLLLPIPQREIDTNEEILIIQNQGY
ncbi:RagB/SusD family nutrient uptake outer membrane protein [Arcticibacter sp.]|uniref:RagB/SusD family nutrient uptake outer membrane protein n=1 Tax=Arcticibacter sp. TaxID=1872630 RepID=UPI0038908E64